MKVAPFAKEESKRIDNLKSYNILDGLPEQAYDDLTYIASRICGTPIALVSLVDESRQWFKSKVGLDASETPRDVAFCSHAILQDDVFEIPDSLKDERFHDNPLAVEAPHVRFYAGAPLKTPEGHKIGTLCVIDHVPRKLNDDQLKSLEALARQVVSLMELKSSQLATRKASEAKSLFLANMSHEIRTPLGGVLSFTDLLLEMDLEGDVLEHVKDIKGCCDNLLSIVNDILDTAKIEAGKLELSLAPLNLNSILQKSVAIFKASAEKKKIELLIDSDIPDSLWIEGDIVRIQQVLLNLIGNAVKFTHEGSVKVLLSKKKPDRAGWFELCFTVQDTGVGIASGAKGKIFEMFEQADNSTTRNYGGTGLGLPICSKLAKMMGGKVEFSSVESKGASFIFSFMAQEVSAPETIDLKDSGLNKTEDFSHWNVLVAEDNEINQKLIKKLLSKVGISKVDLVGDGRSCLNQSQKKKYDIILMDVQMPLMDGLEATAKIKESLKDAPVIIGLSANAFQEDRDMAMKSGMDYYLEKPINSNRLKSVLRKISTR